jgi:TolB-like protein
VTPHASPVKLCLSSILFASGLLLTSANGWAEPVRCLNPGNGISQCLDADPIPVIQPSSTMGKFSAKMIFLADQLERNIDIKDPASSFLIGSFTNLNNLSETSPLGRLIAESLIHELRVRQWRIFEPRLMKNFQISEQGEFTLSRDVTRLREHFGVSGVVTGTFLIANGHMVINARVMDIASGMVQSSGQLQIPANWFTQTLSRDLPDQTIRIIGKQP